MNGLNILKLILNNKPVKLNPMKQLKQIWEDMDVRIKIVIIVLPLIILFLYAFYVHRDEPHWFETKYVKVIK